MTLALASRRLSIWLFWLLRAGGHCGSVRLSVVFMRAKDSQRGPENGVGRVVEVEEGCRMQDRVVCNL